MILSTEQQHILDRTINGNNIVVDAVAGTGKTTLILSIAKELSNKKILQMTYNKSLKFEVREKIESNELENLEVHTFHSLAVCYYNEKAHIDNEIRKIISTNAKPCRKIPEVDILVLDETQDMTFLYFQLMCKYLFDMGKKVQLLVMGDYMQGLYEFKGSDIRYLTFADYLWEKHPLLHTDIFELCSMKMSYRITNQMRHFVNNVLIGENRMNSCRDDQPVQYIRNSRYNIERIVYAEIIKLFENGIKPNDIFVLGPSVKGERSNIRKLENMLVDKNIPCHVPMLDSVDIDQRVIDGKVVFSTFHTVKGRQRKYVFVVGMDHSYFKYYARNLPVDVCPNTIYVACTRATNGLYILENDTRPEDRPLDFIKMSHIQMKEQPYITFKGQHKTLFSVGEERDLQTTIKITPTELIKFIPEEPYQEICILLESITTIERSEHYDIEMPSLIQTKSGFYEEISDLNGIALPCIYYDFLISLWNNDIDCDITENSILYRLIDFYKDDIKEKNKIFLQEMIDKLPEKIKSVKEYLFMANINQAIQESLYFKLKQIEQDEHVWLTDDIVANCKREYSRVISPDCQNSAPKIEECILLSKDDNSHKLIDEFTGQIVKEKVFRFTARVDLITETTLWELKCTSKINTEHILQLAIYTWLWNMKYVDREHNTNIKHFKLFNVKNGELISIQPDMTVLNKIIAILINSRYNTIVPKPDEIFIEDCCDYISSLEQENKLYQ